MRETAVFVGLHVPVSLRVTRIVMDAEARRRAEEEDKNWARLRRLVRGQLPASGAPILEECADTLTDLIMVEVADAAIVMADARRLLRDTDLGRHLMGCGEEKRLAVAQAVREIRESLEPGTPERIFVGLMEECETRDIGSRYSARHIVSQVMQHVDQQAEEIVRLNEDLGKASLAVLDCAPRLAASQKEIARLRAALEAITISDYPYDLAYAVLRGESLDRA